MLISIDWIKDFVSIPDLDIKTLGTKFTLATAEIEEIKTCGEIFEEIIVVEIVSFEKHPEADKLNLVTFKINDSETRRVVCGANNVKVGIKIPYARVGLSLPNGMTLEPKKIRGILSEGMLCSQEELGIPTTLDGIWELDSNTPVGTKMIDYLKLKKDIIIDVDNKSLTHRPDLWGHYGIAREFSAIFESKLSDRFNREWESKLLSIAENSSPSPIKIKFHGDSAGISYFGLSLSGVKVGNTPDWMKRRLEVTGLRSINSIVDISNYVMLELGLPLHIFDRKKIKGDTLTIQSLSSSAKFITLDDVERLLISGDTVISDSEGPLVLAGIMGGKSSGVSDETDEIFIEVANWKAANVRRTSTRLGLRTDSSQRYEKSLDSQLSLRTLLRTLELILELNPTAKVIGKIEYAGIPLNSFSPLKVTTSASRISNVLGKEISEDKVISILDYLGFKATKLSGAILELTVPSYRSTKDIENEQDIIEEIGRIIGYDNITPVSPLDGIAPVKLTQMQKLQRKIKNFLVYDRFFEVMTYPLLGKDVLEKYKFKNSEVLELFNSISSDYSIMRPSMIPSFLSALELNSKYQDRFKIFEIGRVYTPGVNFSQESNILCIGAYDRDSSAFVDLLNSSLSLLDSIGLSSEPVLPNPKFKSSVLPLDWEGIHPVEHRDFRIAGKMIASIFSVHPLLLSKLKIKGHFAFFMFDLTNIADLALKEKVKYKPLNKFPSSSFDWTVTADKDQYIGEIVKAAQKVRMKELDSIEVLDIFTQESKKYVTLRAVLADECGTLTTDFLKSAEASLIKATTDAGFELKK